MNLTQKQTPEVSIIAYLNAFHPGLDSQLLHQLPGLGYAVIGRHVDPSDYTHSGEI